MRRRIGSRVSPLMYASAVTRRRVERSLRIDATPDAHRRPDDLVVDAMNVIGSRPDGWWRDRDLAIRRLVAQLERRGEGRDERVTVMLEHEPREAIRTEWVEIAWASVGDVDAADREILARLLGWLFDDEVTVVTSDRDLKAKALVGGAEVVPSSSFRAELEAL